MQTKITQVFLIAFFIAISYNIIMYEVIYAKSAKQNLNKMQSAKVAQIIAKIEEIALNPYGNHNNVTKLQGREGYRLRVGDWRILYSLNNNKLILLVLEVLPRGSAYKH